MPGGDPSARVYSFTAEEIAARGVSTLEDFFRKLPWTFSSMTTQTSSTSNNNQVFLPGEDSIRFRGNGLGISSLNLRGLGSPNTLILLNGRRIAGVGGVEDDLANLLNVPLSAIERVDFKLADRASAYDFIRRTRVRFHYLGLSKPDRGVIRRYLAKMTGLSRARLTRLIRQYRDAGRSATSAAIW